MTQEEFFDYTDRIRQEADEQIEKIREAEKTQIRTALYLWANDNARFHVGDIIESNGTTIKISGIRGDQDVRNRKIYPVYRGSELTKKLQPRKDATIMSIYDDGREINLVKSK